MIPNKSRSHYLAVKNKISNIKRNNIKNNGYLYCLNCLHSLRTKENKFQSHKNVCKNKDFCNVIIPSEGSKLLEFNQYQESDKEPFSIYADLECLIKKTDECKNNPESSNTTKAGKHIILDFSMSLYHHLKS